MTDIGLFLEARKIMEEAPIPTDDRWVYRAEGMYDLDGYKIEFYPHNQEPEAWAEKS